MTTRSGLRICVAFMSALGLICLEGRAQQAPALPELTFKRLLNDLQVIVASVPNAGDKVTVALVVRYGSSFDPADKGGLTHLLTHMIGRATMDQTAKDIQDELNYLGGSLEAECDWDGMRFFVRAPSARFERALLLLYQVVGEAVFAEDDLAKAKAEILQDLEKPPDPRQKSRTRLETILFRSTTYGRSLTGSRVSLQNITVGDLRLYYRRFFSSGSASLVVAGAVPVAPVLQKATRIWGVWVRKDDVPFTFLPPREPASRNVFLEDDPNSPAAQLVLGGLWPRRDDPAFYPAVLAARILQDRLTKALPTSLLTVGADARRLPGLFYIQEQAAADQSVGEIRKILDVVETLKISGVTPEEVAAAQSRWIQDFNGNLSSLDGICRSILDSELYRLGTNYAISFPELVQRVSTDLVKETAKEWIFPGGVLIVVRGPASTLRPALETLGSVQQIAP